MKYPLGIACATAALTFCFFLCGPSRDGTATAHETGAAHVHFQPPQKDSPRASSSNQLQYRSASSGKTTEPPARNDAQPSATAVRRQTAAMKNVPSPAPASGVPTADSKLAANSSTGVRAVPRAETAFKASRSQNVVQVRPAYLDPRPQSSDAAAKGGIAAAESRSATSSTTPRERSGAGNGTRHADSSIVEPTSYDAELRPASHHGRMMPTGRRIYASGPSLGDPACGLASPGCGMAEPGCGIFEPGCELIEPGCAMVEPGCAMVEPGCAMVEPGCAMVEPGCAAPASCGCGEPTCGICEPGCSFVDPACGCVEGCGDGVSCGSCIDGGADYWCFPVCIPRFKDLSIWGGVHGFKGPRDSLLLGGPADGNFGFQEGIQLGGRAPFIGLIFPELSYQLGYQAVQSRLSGTSGPAPGGSTNERTQHFITGGFFRRVKSGVQGGVVWDMMRDDLVTSQDFHQIRYEISLKSPLGRELGFMGIHHANNQLVGAIDYQSVDQYALFFRCHFRNGSEWRLWGGGTNDNEGLFGGDFYAPFNNRWSLQSGFNYLITDQNAGPIGAREESWNVGMNLVWHFGRSAKQAQSSPHRPLFQVADNGSMFIDQLP